jgi:uncharacterized spore protein YtfJ
VNKDDMQNLVTTILGEVEKVLGSKTVVGDPIVIGDSTLIPLISVGVGFGAGTGGAADRKQQGENITGGAGAGAGVRPVAIIIVDKDGARIEPIKSGMASALEKIGETIPEIMDKFIEKWGNKEKQG